MTHENNPATHLIKQGEVLRWKNPYESTINHPVYGEIQSRHAFYYPFEDFAVANPIHAIGDWPDKEEFSREEVEITEQVSLQGDWVDKSSAITDKWPKFRLAARYKGEPKSLYKEGYENKILYADGEWREAPADINAGQSENSFDLLNYDLSQLPEDKKKEFVDGFINITAENALKIFIALKLQDGIDAEIVNVPTNDKFRFSFKKILPAKEEPSPVRNTLLEQLRKDTPEEVKQYADAHIRALDLLEDYKEQFRAELIKKLEERISELKRDKYIDTRDKTIRIKEIRLIMTMVKSVK